MLTCFGGLLIREYRMLLLSGVIFTMPTILKNSGGSGKQSHTSCLVVHQQPTYSAALGIFMSLRINPLAIILQLPRKCLLFVLLPLKFRLHK